MIRVKKAVLEHDYSVYLEFGNGKKGRIDFRPILENDHRKIIRELLEPDKFKTMRLDRHTVCWDNGVDFAPEFLYEQMETIHPPKKEGAAS